MKTKVIKKGNHYCTPLQIPNILFGDNLTQKFTISFDESCKYTFNDDD
jgi:hypothetical protein